MLLSSPKARLITFSKTRLIKFYLNNWHDRSLISFTWILQDFEIHFFFYKRLTWALQIVNFTIPFDTFKLYDLNLNAL